MATQGYMHRALMQLRSLAELQEAAPLHRTVNYFCYLHDTSFASPWRLSNPSKCHGWLRLCGVAIGPIWHRHRPTTPKELSYGALHKGGAQWKINGKLAKAAI